MMGYRVFKLHTTAAVAIRFFASVQGREPIHFERRALVQGWKSRLRDPGVIGSSAPQSSLLACRR